MSLHVLFGLLCTLKLAELQQQRNVGGAGDTKAADDSIHKLCMEIRSEVESRSGTTYEVFEATSYKSQVVAGTNYFVKVKVADEAHIHIRVFKSLPHAGEKLSLHAIHTNKQAHDQLDYFDRDEL